MASEGRVVDITGFEQPCPPPVGYRCIRCGCAQHWSFYFYDAGEHKHAAHGVE